MQSMKVMIEVDIPGLGAALKRRREEKRLTPTFVAAAVGMTAANLYRIEGEENKSIPFKTLKELAKILEIDLTQYSDKF